MARVELTTHLHRFFPVLADRELRVEGATVAEVVRGIEAIAPGFAFYICDERGRLRRHVNIFVADQLIADRKSLSDSIGDDERLLIMQALSGG